MSLIRRLQRKKWLSVYNSERKLAEQVESRINQGQREYNTLLKKYNKIIGKQKYTIDRANYYKRWGDIWREGVIREQQEMMLYAYAAEYVIAKAEKKHKAWSEFTELNNKDLWPNGQGQARLIKRISFILQIKDWQIGRAYNYVKQEDLVHTAKLLATYAEIHKRNFEHNLAGTNERYAKMNEYFTQAKNHAKEAEKYYKKIMRPLAAKIEKHVPIAQQHYTKANNAAKQVESIDTQAKNKIDAANNMQRQAQALLNYYENEASELHWLAVSADAEGKITEFKQGKHVSTEVVYEEDTGRLKSVFAQSTPAPIELEAGQSIPNTTNRLTDFLSLVQSKKTEAAGFATQSYAQLTQTQKMIAELNPNDGSLSPAMQAATQAQITALQVNKAIFQVDYQLNTDIGTLASTTLSKANAMQAEFKTIKNDSLGKQEAINNVLVYNARVHALIASYHNQLKGLYEFAAHQQTQKATQVNNTAKVKASFLQEYAKLGTHHSNIAAQLQSRADAIKVKDGSDKADPALYGMAKAAYRHKRLIDRHADVSSKRRRLNVALFAPLQHLNEASRQKYHNKDGALSGHFANNKQLGRSDRERFKQLESLYRNRLSVLEAQNTEDKDIFANDTERKALYENLAQVNTQLGVMYGNMSSKAYWSDMNTRFANSLNDKSAVYRKLAKNHHQIATNHQMLAGKSSELYDHQVLGNEDVILNDTYEWDALGNLTERKHLVADLIESFEYDSLNRLTRSSIEGNAAKFYQLNGTAQIDYEYNALGNLTYKSDIGHYTYANNAGPHAVTAISGNGLAGQKNTSYLYDANGNMLSGDGKQIAYTSFNKPKQIQAASEKSTFIYGPERQLIQQVEYTSKTNAEGKVTPSLPKTTVYIGNQYQKIFDGYKTTEKYHISTHNGATIAVIIDDENATAPKTHYLHRDHLDSIVAITNEQGHVVERFYYDAFGKQLAAVTPTGDNLYKNTLDLHLTDRGFTGHKTIQSGLVHMGGRVYDPSIGRFLSADPHIQFAGNLQNYNRYSYVNNNPLSFNDPSGYFISKLFKGLKKLFKFVAKIVKKVINVVKKVVKFIKENLRIVVAIVVAVAVPIAAGFILGGASTVASALSWVTTTASFSTVAGIGALAGGLSSLVATGSLTAAFKGAVFGAITAGVGYGFRAGKALAVAFGKASRLAQVTAHGIIGGLRAKVDGMSFSKGFLSAAVAKAFTPAAMSVVKNNVFVQGLAVASIGGIASKLAGGSFEMGFMAAGVAFAVNQVLTSIDKAKTYKAYNKLRNRVKKFSDDNPGSKIDLSEADLRVIAKHMFHKGQYARYGEQKSYIDAKKHADTFIYSDQKLNSSIYSIDGLGAYRGSEVNYIGVGAFSRAYGLNAYQAYYMNAAEGVAWNALQSIGLMGGSGNWQSLLDAPRNTAFANIGSTLSLD